MRKLQINMQAENEQGADTESSPAKRERKEVSSRDFLDTAGNVVDKIEEATGARYTLKETGQNFDMQFGEAGKPGTMFAIFGFHTKVGNVVNTVLNDKNEPGDATDAGASATEFLTLIQQGKWAERAAGGAAVRIDKDALANAIVTVAQNSTPPKQVDQAAIRQKLEDDPTFVRTARQVPAIAQEYAKLTGKAKTVDELLGSLS